MPSSIPGSDTESEGASVAPRPSPPLGEARAKPALESGPTHPLAQMPRAVGRFARRKPLGALGALIVVAMLVMAAFAERIAPYGYDDTIRGARMRPPGAAAAPARGGAGGATRAAPPPPRAGRARPPGAAPAGLPPRHILPNVTATIIILATIGLGAVTLAESALSFLGFGVPPPFPSWGAMLSGSGRTYMFRAPWMAVWPGVAISLAVFGFNMLGDALRDVLDPRLRGGAR